MARIGGRRRSLARTLGRLPRVGQTVRPIGLQDKDLVPLFTDSRQIRSGLADVGYIASRETAFAVHLADLTGRPLLLEGNTGVGKTELARALAQSAGARLIRLQCYEGVGEQEALFAWNHAKQILRLQSSTHAVDVGIFSDEFLLERPLLTALRSEQPTVLLVDEVDKAQIEFDALLLEVLGDFAITIGEYGTVSAVRRPLVILTSGGKRELSEALRRRCHFSRLPNPSSGMERRILAYRIPDAEAGFAITRDTAGQSSADPTELGWHDLLDSLRRRGLLNHVIGFVDALRDNGLPCGPAALVDAVAALQCIDLYDRGQVRGALCATLVHREVELLTFAALFDLWFAVARPDRRTDRDKDTTPSALAERMAAASDDLDASAFGDAVGSIAADLVSEFGEYRSADGDSYSAMQAMRGLDTAETTNRIAMHIAAGLPPTAMSSVIAERTAQAQLDLLQRAVTLETNRLVAQRRGRDRVARYAVPRTAGMDEPDAGDTSELAAVRRAVVDLGRTLAVRQATTRRRARAGEIDLRSTLRRSMSTGGVPITLVRRKPRIAKPELVVLCDMSSSVAEFSYFTLILVDALRKAFSRVRIFAFIDTVDEVTDLFAPGTDLRVAVAKLNSEAAIDIDGRSDYGRALESFASAYPNAMTSRTSLIVIGDARSNYSDPRAAVLRDLVASAKHARWLNPEPRSRWGTGDSAAEAYREQITMCECRNADQLSSVVAELLDS
ncbi:VWA domain-containing protein [Antrihabitans sp. YC3-6]|uniref:VWA domain-containing protein n=1 Tax=Antrihabitans stalagmiti TaxID=2799499 RepID=A0A934U0T3_9NOCA|nr:VWA domain-containing protein [Antrihabitans stalagmiti]MBJ8337845.1 VWA domain-containing protein [Antrihabitans stalagmiti]